MRFYPQIVSNIEKSKDMSLRFNAKVLFADISGFTSMTEILAKKGRSGTETVGDVLKSVFGRSSAIINRRGGFISSFAGDAFTGIFPEEYVSDENFFSALSEINGNFKEMSQITELPLQLSIKIGAGRGEVTGRVIDAGSKRMFWFKGRGIKRAVEAEKLSLPMETVIHRFSFREKKLYEEDNVRNEKFASIKSSHVVQNLKLIKEEEKQEDFIFGSYFPELQNKNLLGEFKRIVSVFISLKEEKNLKENIKSLAKIAEDFRGYIPMVDISDKGTTMPVFFGMPLSRENDIRAAMNFALQAKNILPSGASFGIAEGTAYCGTVGGEEYSSYTAFGDKVNTAARLMQAANPGEILTDERTAEACSSSFLFEKRGEIFVKGKTDSVSVSLLTGEARKKKMFFGSSRMLGRDEEREYIANKVSKLSESGSVVYICGEAGTGKSRLVSEALSSSSVNHGEAFMQCDSVLRKSFNPVSYFLSCYFGVYEFDKAEEKKKKFEEGIKEILRNSGEESDFAEELKRKESLIGALLGIRWQNSFFERIEPKQIFENTVLALHSLFKAMSAEKPLVIVVEDAHWIDSETKEFFRYLVRNIKDEKILLIATYRFGDDGSVFSFSEDSKDDEQQIMLENLTRESSSEAVTEILSGRISEKAAGYIFDKSQGNPFHIESLVRYLHEGGYLSRVNGVYEIASNTDEIPASLNSVLTARIDRMEKKLKECVLWASVLGREFEKSMVDIVTGADSESLINAGEEETVWSSLGGGRYIFNHGLLSDCAYEMQLTRELKSRHAKVAKILEKKYRRKKGRFAEIAYHYEKSGIVEKAVKWLGAASDASMKNWANKDAERMLDKLIKFDLSDKEKIEISMKLAEVYFRTGRIRESLESYLKNKERAEKIKEKILVYANILEAGKTYLTMGRYNEAESLLLDSMQRFAESEMKREEGEAAGQLARVYMYRSEYGKAVEMCDKSLEISRSVNNLSGVSLAFGIKGTINAMKGEYNDAIRFYKERMKIARKINDQYGITSVIGNMGIIWKQKGYYRKAVKYYIKDIEVCKKIGYETSINVTYSNLGLLYRELGEFENAEESLKKSIALSEKNGDEGTKANSLGNLGIVYKDQGMLEEAENMFLKQVSLCEKNNDRYCMCIGNGNLGLLYFNREDFDRGYEYIEKQRVLAEQIEDINNLSIAYESISILDYHRGDADRALENVNRALSIIEGKKKDYLLCGFLCNKARILHKAGRNAEALRLVKESIAAAKRIKRKEIFFEANLLLAVIRKSQKTLMKMLSNEQNNEKQGYILKELYLLSGNSELKEKALNKLSEEDNLHPSIYLKHAILELKQRSDYEKNHCSMRINLHRVPRLYS
ncbi:MAG: tetratricopeptide repeat protein [bacterium]|nr:tetratricopeptide repeat protein [bacterium]